jgi:hypothetical protein
MRKLFSAALLGLVAIAACDDDDDGVGPAQEGRLRVVHAVSNVTATDVYVDGTQIKADLAYKSVDPYRANDAGTRTVKVRKADAATDLVSINQTIQPNRDHTLIAYGTETQPKSISLTDDNTAPAAGKAKLRVVHAAAVQGNVDVYAVADEDDLDDATAAATNLAPGAASAYITLDAGTRFVILTGAGNRTPVLTVQGVDLGDGKIRTIVAVEKAGGGTPLEGVKLDDR